MDFDMIQILKAKAGHDANKALNQLMSKKKDNLIDQWVDYKYWLRIWAGSMEISAKAPKEVREAMFKYPWARISLKSMHMIKNWNIGRGGGALRESYANFDARVQLSKQGGGMADLFTDPEHTVLYNAMVPVEIFNAMDLKHFTVETPANMVAMMEQNSPQPYYDDLYNEGLPSDTCTYASLTPAFVEDDQIPGLKCPCLIASNLPCEGGSASWAIMQEKFGIPTYRLDIPADFNDNPQAITDFTEDLRGMIAFLEEHTGHTMDWDKLRHICENVNTCMRAEMERFELNRSMDPPVCGDLLWSTHMNFFNLVAGSDAAAELYTDLAKQGRAMHEKGEGSVKNMKYRAVLWNPPSFCYSNMWNWLERCWGIGVVMDMESFLSPVYIDTRTHDSMLAGLAEQWCYAPMARHNRGPAENWLNALDEVSNLYRPDFILNMNHIGCRASVGLVGAMKDWSKKTDVPVCLVDHDFYDSRVVSRQGIRDQVNRFMQDVMHATPLDPSLLNFDDSQVW